VFNQKLVKFLSRRIVFAAAPAQAIGGNEKVKPPRLRALLLEFHFPCWSLLSSYSSDVLLPNKKKGGKIFGFIFLS